MKLFQVDAFTDEKFKGNPAGVCILPETMIENDSLLQDLAAEMNLSETAFLTRQKNGYRLRWFTPVSEVKLCGHATLSSAHILWETGGEPEDAVLHFYTLSGELTARKNGDLIELDFPAAATEPVDNQPEINSALGMTPLFTGSSRGSYLIEIADYETLKQLQPDFTALKRIGHTTFIVTCASDNQEFDFYSRFFAPAVGIDEDPVTGSSHTSLAPYWSKKLGKRTLRAYQASKRGGTIECEVLPNERVLLRGKAVTVFTIETSF